MIPQFPDFKKLELSDKTEFEEYTKKFLPYSDFNFVSIYSYNTEELIKIAIFSSNLVVMFTDYISNKPFLSFIGNTNVKETIRTLLDYSQQNGLPRELALIPEVNLQTREELTEFTIFEDPDNFDYILSVEEIKTLVGNKYRGKRNFVSRFLREYGEREIQLLDLKDRAIQKEIEELFSLWQKQSEKTKEETATELTAIRRLFGAVEKFSLIPIGIYIDNRLAAFSIDELVQENYAVIHFEKANTKYTGIYQYLKQMTAKHVSSLGCKHINYEQDLALPGLKKAKQSWMPISYLKKYRIRLQNKITIEKQIPDTYS